MVIYVFSLILQYCMERPPILAVVFGSGFGSGFWPWGPGTAGALLATIAWLGMACVFNTEALLLTTFVLILLFTCIGTWAANKLEPYWGEDPSRVVIDEMVGVWVPLLCSPQGSLTYAAVSFVIFRFFDIVKPLGIRTLDRKHGGFWVMADDLLAGIYSLIIIVLARWTA